MGISVKWLGHASFEIKAGNKIVYIDPYKGEYKEKADLLLISHSHNDHCSLTKIKKIINEDTLVIAPSDCVSKIRGKVKSLKPEEKVSVGDISVEAVEAYNYKRFKSPGHPFHPKGFGVGYLITIGEKTIYHAGDTDFIPEMRNLRNIYLALLPSGGTYTMDNPDAAESALAIKPEFVIPMHRWNTNPNEFKKNVEANSKLKVILLKSGEEFRAE
jgi:L-ascorbate metabolism protein UlaG (beta-lactamase superfamily)